MATRGDVWAYGIFLEWQMRGTTEQFRDEQRVDELLKDIEKLLLDNGFGQWKATPYLDLVPQIMDK